MTNDHKDTSPVQPIVGPPKSSLGDTVGFNPATSTDAPHAASRAESARAWVGKTLGKYQITGVLGEGGMGIVLKAHDPLIERDVAVKLLAEHLAADATSLSRFLSEARAAGKLNHPNVVAIYEIGQEGATHFLALEYVPGGSLSDRLQEQGACAAPAATRAVMDACKGLAA